jgi:hypothetical protein
MRIASCFGILVLLFLATTAIPVPAIAAGAGDNYGLRNIVMNPEPAPLDLSELNATAREKFHKEPEPVTLFSFGINKTALPGPRYMAFGPSVIGISISPVILSALIVLVFAGIAAWCIRISGKTRDRRDE